MRIVKWMKNGLHLKENSINMSRLYIIGNGFDIAHGIPCRYSDFRRYCKEEMPEMYEKLNRYYDGGDKLWSDFESEGKKQIISKPKFAMLLSAVDTN